ncbi:nucleoside 2-deoxyribosyltransferase [Variovorax sp. ZS18.2.2]|uniref:nucleoside 2-deoxyribosyltransferase n=1 Tax=Variovorax sp. ZS18.2.2 TaxID=2971255 RepID=UPI002151AF5E|nr:nucleoside 2-deoxyribosyltransferase [Variovorax sp. ZS18.2.2]MCR6481030.1 nucleoside 2-deoxyribosyltransferase [Variovorax sp. ZS18.2.2]
MNTPSTLARPRVYLAGPDVFHPNSDDIFAGLIADCERFGLEALVPSDSAHEKLKGGGATTTGEQKAQCFFEANIDMLRRADAVVANLQAFRGLEPDSGTVFEVGFAHALGLPVVAYGVPATTYGARVCAALGSVRDAHGAMRDRATGMMVEEFDQRLNLMLARSVVAIADSPEAALRQVAEQLRAQSSARCSVGR